MTFYEIYEDVHGLIGIAATPKAAIAYLIYHEGIHNIFDNKTEKYVPIEQKFGSNWKDVLLNMSMDEFNDYFLDSFYIEEETLITKEHY